MLIGCMYIFTIIYRIQVAWFKISFSNGGMLNSLQTEKAEELVFR